MANVTFKQATVLKAVVAVGNVPAVIYTPV